MKTFLSIVSAAILTVAAGTASAAPVQLTTAQLDNVTAGATSWASSGGFAAGLFPSSTSDSYSSASGGWWFGGSSYSYAYNSSSALVGVVGSSASSGACSWC